MTEVPPPEPEPSPPGAGPAPRRPRRLRRILLIAAVMLVVCCGGVVAVTAAVVRWYNPTAGAARSATDGFLSLLERDDTAGAYRQLCGDVRAHLSQDAFTKLVHGQPRLRSHRVVDTSVSRVNGRDTALVTADLTREGNVHDRHTVRLIRDGRSWFVCGDPY